MRQDSYYILWIAQKKITKTSYNNLINTISKMGKIFMNTEIGKKNETQGFRLKLADNLNLKDPNKNIMANLSICYTWKNVESAYKNNKFNISAPTWND